MQKLYPLIEEADALILGSPTYFYDVTGLMKTFLDRLYCYEGFDALDRSVWMSLFEATSSKLAAVIRVCEQTRPEDTGYAAKTMALTMKSLGYRITDSTEILRLYQKDQARGDEHAVNRARSTGEKLARTVLLKKKILEEGKSAEK
jgi:multimeric flavodoxin WrbA